jgi:ribonuclease HI
LAELWAIGMVLDLIRELPHRVIPYLLIIFTDSTFSVDVVQGQSTSSLFALHIHVIRSKRDALISEGIISAMILSWVPGHAGLAQNEQADLLADLGSSASVLNKGVIDIPHCLSKKVFIPD